MKRNRQRHKLVLRSRALARRFLSDTRGATATLVALSITALLGFAGAATETGVWYVAKRNMQGAADAAAFGAALARPAGQIVYTAEARGAAAGYGFVNAASGVTVTVNNPPTLGTFAGNSNAVEVIIQQPQTRMFSALFESTPMMIKARAVATASFGAPACVLAMNTGASVDMLVNGTTNVNLTNCGLAVNSSGASALDIVGGAVINAASAAIVGGIGGNGTLNTTIGTQTGSAPAQDPYQDVQLPSYSGCNQSSYNPPSHSTNSISANNGTYVFCNGISLGAGTSLSLSNGIFVIDRGTLALNGQSTLNISNATVILTSSTGSNYATVAVNGGATVNVTAPTSGATAGLAFFQDRNAPNGTSNTFAGGTTQNITGALYFPNQTVNFAGGTQTGGSSCTQIVADQVNFKGNATLNSNCAGMGVRTITSPPQLVE